jgi:hypothetical protein
MNFHIISNTSHLLLIETPMDFSGSLLLYLIVVPIFFLIGAFQLRAGTVFAGKKCAATPSGALSRSIQRYMPMTGLSRRSDAQLPLTSDKKETDGKFNGLDCPVSDSTLVSFYFG